MFNKLRLKLKDKLKNYLDIYIVENNVNKANSRFTDYAIDTERIIKSNIKAIDYNRESIDALHSTIENVVHIGTDVRRNDCNDYHSWAVVCIEGKMNIVKFVNLERKDGRYVFDFLKQFEAGKHCIDAPCQEIFYDGLWKF